MAGEMSGVTRPEFTGSRHAASYNLRDFGAYRTRSGAMLRQGLLYRSGQLDVVAPEDHGLVARLGIGEILDMRSHSELGSAPPPALEGFAGRILLASAPDGLIPHAMAGFAGMRSRQEVNAHVRKVYRALPLSPRFIESLKLLFEMLTRPEGAVLVHCFAGKDRTGLGVAIVHHAFSVHPDDAMADYLLTNAQGEERIASGIRVLRQQMPPEVSEALLREVMMVRSEYLDDALAAINAAHGSLGAYLATHLGLDGGAIEKIAARFLV